MSKAELIIITIFSGEHFKHLCCKPEVASHTVTKLKVSCRKINADETEAEFDPNSEDYFKDFLKTF